MTDTISVLLIIGAAVVGPIEAQPGRVYMEVPNSADHHRCYPGNDDERCKLSVLQGQPIQHEPDETVAQLCERAMREIGAIKGPHQSGMSVSQGPYVANGLHVSCIPTPTGYRK